jgi:hypothetical protein
MSLSQIFTKIRLVKTILERIVKSSPEDLDFILITRSKNEEGDVTTECTLHLNSYDGAAAIDNKYRTTMAMYIQQERYKLLCNNGHYVVRCLNEQGLPELMPSLVKGFMYLVIGIIPEKDGTLYYQLEGFVDEKTGLFHKYRKDRFEMMLPATKLN